MWMRKTKHPACLVERRSGEETDDQKEECGGSGKWARSDVAGKVGEGRELLGAVEWVTSSFVGAERREC